MQPPPHPPHLQVVSTLRDFLTSATVKDCGVMCAIQRVDITKEKAAELAEQAVARCAFKGGGY